MALPRGWLDETLSHHHMATLFLLYAFQNESPRRVSRPVSEEVLNPKTPGLLSWIAWAWEHSGKDSEHWYRYNKDEKFLMCT